MKKIYIPVGGRLGNQLFYYGFGRWLQIKYFPQYELCFDFSAVKKQGEDYRYEKSGWENSLKLFNTKQYEEYSKDLAVYREGTFFQKATSFFIKKVKNNRDLGDNEIRVLSKYGLVYNCREQLENLYSFQKINGRDIFVRSVLESDYYINQIRDKLLEEIVPKHERKKENQVLYDIIEHTESVCISIRRGDYVTNPELNHRFNICDKSYFEKGIYEIKSKVTNPTLIFFSDDIEWCRKNFEGKIGVPAYFESGRDDLSEKLRLMSTCKHFIISNSTFSWWAQWLATNEKKIVISPSIWFRDQDSSLVSGSFLKIDVN